MWLLKRGGRGRERVRVREKERNYKDGILNIELASVSWSESVGIDFDNKACS